MSATNDTPEQLRLARLREILDSGAMRSAGRLLDSLAPAEIGHLIESLPPTQREILWGMALTDTAIVFSEDDIQYPMHLVLDFPVGTHSFQCQRGIAFETGDEVPRLDRGLCPPSCGSHSPQNPALRRTRRALGWLCTSLLDCL